MLHLLLTAAEEHSHAVSRTPSMANSLRLPTYTTRSEGADQVQSAQPTHIIDAATPSGSTDV
jgi:hypothetical protein